MSKSIRSALISVYYKDKLDLIVRELHKNNVTIYSTGGTLSFIESLGVPVVAVDALTGFPEILGGRVKTLHPKVFGGILARRDNDSDVAQLQQHDIPEIDLVIVDLYPFEETVKSTQNEQEIIEKIDIGGISLIRAAAKNFKDTLIVSSRSQYDELLALLQAKNGASDIEDRKLFAAKAFMTSSHYDTLIFEYFNKGLALPVFKQSLLEAKTLRYGENPHQKGTFYGHLSEVFEILNGKELSYNNLVDVEASINLAAEFTEPTFAIIKHTNSCGLASRPTISEAYTAALACDPTSAFGGVLAANRKIDVATANEVSNLFFEVLTAPDYEPEALQILMQKKNRILLKLKSGWKQPAKMFKSLLNGVLEQDVDSVSDSKESFKVVTEKSPSAQELSDLEFAIIAVKHLKSNGITLVKNKQLIGMGCGQTSRVDSLESALKKAKAFGFDTTGAVMASEAFFPFPDCVNISAEAGIAAISQPGGSIKDQDSIAAANANGQAMVMTGVRHFKH
ncbi:MAG: bifunctional phosphoribosylaminoimidazolecarboxamide formyltransferase/IMP cyclohydrolase [Bacteroidetes bacterium]|nr:bifunctional phosphoribosylaminoimidazolecarboxamide formyltransferase/IMP cyclohydrolase [Bacteroidota bacterium]